MHPKNDRGLRLMAVLFVLALVPAACGDSADTTVGPEATSPTTQLSATTQPPATTQQRTTAPLPATTQAPTTIAAPTTTATEATTTTLAVSGAQLEAAAAVGDWAAGKALFDKSLDGVPHDAKCSTCHTVDGRDTPDAPTLAGISGVAASRVDGLSDVAYLRQSILAPSEFRLDGDWRFPMPYQYPDVLTEGEINDLIAFLLTR